MDELEISGRRFLSTRRAAKEHKYTADYVGQLIRGGKVVGKKVGRSWYVDEESLNAYLRGEAVEPKPAVKTAVKEPAPVEPAHPAPPAEAVPHITAQLEVKEVKPTTEVVAEKTSEEKVFEPVVVKTKNLEEYHIPIRTQKEKPMGGLRYVADEEPALPEIAKKSAPVIAQHSAPHKAEPRIEVAEEPVETYAEEEEVVEFTPHKRSPVFAIAGLVVVGLLTLSATAFVSSTLNSHIVVEEGQVASVGWSFQ